jgi:hypothetical protein
MSHYGFRIAILDFASNSRSAVLSLCGNAGVVRVAMPKPVSFSLTFARVSFFVVVSLFGNSSHIGERVAGSIESGGEQTSRRTRPYVSIAAWHSSVCFDALDALRSHIVRKDTQPPILLLSHFIACLAMAHRLTISTHLTRDNATHFAGLCSLSTLVDVSNRGGRRELSVAIDLARSHANPCSRTLASVDEV